MSIIAKINELKTNNYNQYVIIRRKLFKQFTDELQNEQMEKICNEAKDTFECSSCLENNIQFLKYTVVTDHGKHGTEWQNKNIIVTLLNGTLKIDVTFTDGDSCGYYICLTYDNIKITKMSEEQCDLSNLFLGVSKLKLIYDKIIKMNHENISNDYDLDAFTEDLNSLMVKLQDFYIEDDEDD
jgi:hypothetical protein